MRFAFITNPDAVNSNYRAYGPLTMLKGRGHEVEYNRPGEPLIVLDSLMRCDAVAVHRYTDKRMRQALSLLRSAGVGIIWDNDDDIANVPRSNPHYMQFGGLNRQRVLSELSKTQVLADVVTTPSEVLASSFRRSGVADVRVLDNFLPPEFERALSRSRREPVTIAYLAGLEHQLDYQELGLRDVLLRLLERHDDLRVVSIGLGLGLPETRYEHIPLADFLDLASILSNADIGLAPLVDIPWNRARSNVKLKEYGIAGLTWMASPVGAYAPLGYNEGGQLVSDCDWLEALEDIVTNHRKRRKLSKRARKWALTQTMSRNAGVWEQAFLDAAERGHRRAKLIASPG